MERKIQNDWWQAIMARDKSFDGAFVYGVRSTGIYCRPSCSARRPRRDLVSFFRIPAAAEQAGFRPCRRCRPNEGDPQVNLVQRLSRYIENYNSFEKPLTLAVMSTYAEAEDLIRIGAYARGTSPTIDKAVELMPELDVFLCQRIGERETLQGALEGLKRITDRWQF